MILPQIITLTPDFYAYKTQAIAIPHSWSLLKNKTVFLYQALSLNTLTLHSSNVFSFKKFPPIPIFQNIPSPNLFLSYTLWFIGTKMSPTPSNSTVSLLLAVGFYYLTSSVCLHMVNAQKTFV